MNTLKVLNAVKPLIHWFLPFFKENKALALIKADMQSVSEEFLVRAYDATKNLFLIDEERKPLFEQWLKAVEEEKLPNETAEILVKGVIDKNLQTETDFKIEITELLKQIEKAYPEKIAKQNSISGTFTDTQVFQDINNSTISINKNTTPNQ